MKSLLAAIPKLSYALFAAFLVAMAVRSNSETTVAIVASSLLMFACCWANASHLLGVRAALKFVLIAVAFGWFAEQMGVSRGWFFGRYVYTDVLGWRLGDVPVVIPLMWFALCYACYVIGNLIVWRSPLHGSPRLSDAVFMSFLAAMLVTAFDLGADPYMVYQLKAWIMTSTDGWWFGETIQGFFGWVAVASSILFSFRVAVRNQTLRPLADFSKWHALLPLSLYASAMLFQLCVGYPMETRTIAVFAMGIPILCALAGWHHWKLLPAADPVESLVSKARLAHMQYLADPLADSTIANILGPWPLSPDAVSQSEHWQNIAQVNRQFEQWTNNRSLMNWQSADATLSPEISLALQQYLQAGQVLPAWADRAKIARAEVLFMDYGALSCSLLFCSSLPECYVIPDLSAVLHVAGQLEQHTDHRIRATAAMVFPVMMKGGLGQPDGSGLAQILKVRLIHATIRNLILRGSPQAAMHALGDQQHVKGAGVLAPLSLPGTDSMYQSLLAHGWKLGEDGLPCNQEELAYTLLTFAYVFLRSMRRLGLGLPPSDEEAYLHAWNVVGHVLGIRRELMADTMTQAEVLFTQMQARGRANPVNPDARPALGEALMNVMEQAIPFRLLKPFPAAMTRYLCGSPSAGDIGLTGRVPWLTHGLFVLFMLTTRIIDGVVRLVFPEFSISRLITRVLGYHFMSQILLDQTRPLKLPEHLLNDINSAMDAWGHDPKAPHWLNNLEDRMTKPGKWNVPTTT
ncbi:carotenoid biosynthesis protein [Rhodoferax sp. UBA5149]|uniref:carotenoid biosynthesis protein n=1 Tax=Rhodoferax sp. UBA5149 TaxID=1947379 RepID=UPI0025EC0282|nr:carotenoid biosynthesis protein [Rhodoferax sp. UBA5149]